MRKFLSLSVSLLESVAPRAVRIFLPNSPCISSIRSFRIMGSVICKNSPNTDGANKQQDKMEANQEYVEGVVCKEDDVKENEMKVFDLDEGKVLLVRQNGKLNALGTKCTHYGAPLVNGALGKGRIRCPWHGACFNINSGDIEDFPGLDSLPCYQVSIQEGNVKVRARKSDLEENKRVKTMSCKDSREGTAMVVIGGGPSGAVCVETLRQEGFSGRITLINKENALPYDRVKVSKALDVEIDKIQLRSDEFYANNGIEVLKNTEATRVDTSAKEVTLNTGATLPYDCLYIATGSKASKAPIPGADLPEVCVLRGFEDSKFVYERLSEDKHIVCLGVSFVGMEAAAYCVSKVKSVTVVGRGSVPFKPLFGEEIGRQVMKVFEEKGVQFVMHSGLTKCIGENGKLTGVELKDGRTLPADICIMGVGSSLYTEFLQDSGVDLNSDGSITVNEYLETNVPGVYAGGDIAHAPVFSYNNAKSTIGHYPLAHYHGRVAALNMLGKAVPLKAVPYFWTMLFGKSFRYAGHGRHDEIKVVGSLEELKYVAFHLKDDEVVAMSSCQRDPVVSQFANLLAEGRKLYWKDIAQDPLSWTK
ncbi:uncharacterized protein CBL_12929 [Carabus blaptoides fortunei]